MADTKISALASGSPGAIGDEFVLARSGVDYKLTLAQLIAATKLDYVERTTNLTVTPTSAATAAAFITGNAITFDGSTLVRVEFWIGVAEITASQAIVAELYDGSTDLGSIGEFTANAGTGNSNGTIKGERFLTPSAASHTFSIRFWKTGGTATAYAASGVALPSWLRVTLA